MSSLYLREIQYLKESSRRFSGVSDVLLTEIVSAFYNHRTVDTIIRIRRRTRNTLSFLQSPRFSFDPINEVGLLNLQAAFSHLNDYLKLEEDENRNRINNSLGNSSEINMKGKFKLIDEETGNNITYSTNDVVYYDGKTYIATSAVQGCVPSNYAHPDCSGWQPIDLPDNKVGYEESGF